MQLSAAGEIVQKIWAEMPRQFPHVVLDNFVAMPNHIHGIIGIDRDNPGTDRDNPGTDRDNPGRDAINRVSTGDGGDGADRGGVTGDHNPMLSDGSLSQIMRWYKGRCTFEIRPILPEFGWQPRFHDHIIRDEMALNRIRHYIATNPQKWNGDRHYQPHIPIR